MAARPGTFRFSYGPKGGLYQLQYSQVKSAPVEFSAGSAVGLFLDIEVMDERALSDPELEKTAKTLAEECCANNLLKWANESGFKIEWIDGNDALCSKMETFDEPTLTDSDQQPSVSVGMTILDAKWVHDDVVNNESWISRYNRETEGVIYAITGYVKDSVTAANDTDTVPGDHESFAMLVSFKKGAK